MPKFVMFGSVGAWPTDGSLSQSGDITAQLP